MRAWCAVSMRELREAAPSLGRSSVGPNTMPMFPADIWFTRSCTVTLQTTKHSHSSGEVQDNKWCRLTQRKSLTCDTHHVTRLSQAQVGPDER